MLHQEISNGVVTDRPQSRWFCTELSLLEKKSEVNSGKTTITPLAVTGGQENNFCQLSWLPTLPSIPTYELEISVKTEIDKSRNEVIRKSGVVDQC